MSAGLVFAPAVAPNITGQQPHMNLMLSLMIESKANHSKKRGEVSGVASGVSFWFLTSFELSGACFSNCDYHSFIRNSIAHDCIWVLTAEVNDSRNGAAAAAAKFWCIMFWNGRGRPKTRYQMDRTNGISERLEKWSCGCKTRQRII